MPGVNGLTIPREDLKGSIRETTVDQSFVAPVVAPMIEVPTPSGSCGIVVAGVMRTPQNTDRQQNGSYNRSSWDLSQFNWTTKERGHEELLDDNQANVFRSYCDFERARADRVRAVMALDREIRTAALAQNTTTFTGSALFLDTTVVWSDLANNTPIDDVLSGKESSFAGNGGMELDNLVITRKQYRYLSRSAQIIAQLKYGSAIMNNGLLNLVALADILQVAKVHVASAVYNSANKGLAPVYSPIWSDSYAFLFRGAQSGNIEEPAVIRTAVYKGDGGGDPDDPNFEEYVVNDIRSSVLRGRGQFTEQVVTTGLGFLFKVD